MRFRSTKTWSTIGLVALLTLVLDQWSKAWVRSHLAPLDSWAIIPGAEKYFTITRSSNTGAAFGMLKGAGAFFVIVAVVIIAAILYYAYQMQEQSTILNIALGLEVGGALGNLMDRIRFGQVTDFIDFKIWPRYNLWPTFNLADAAITVGVILMAYVFLTMGETEEKRYSPPSHS